VWVDSQPLGRVQPAGGACNNSELPEPYCSGMYDWDSCNPPPPPIDETPDVEDTFAGCNASGGSAGWLVGLLGLALLRRRRAKLALVGVALLAGRRRRRR
jgi:uncharacterized protein (TIGR03382 family)